MVSERHSYVQFYPSDWIAGTAYMPALAEWLYLQVCLYNWDKREPLPAAQAAIRFSRSPSWQADLDMLVECGNVIKRKGGGLYVERAMVEANKAYDLWERKSRGGKSRQSKGVEEDSFRTPDRTATSTPASNQNQNQNQNQIQNQNQNQSPADGDCPPDPPAGRLMFSVPADALKAFRDHRTKIQSPMTLRAEELVIGKLGKIHFEHGHDPTAVIEQSVLNGWRGVFPLKGNDDGRSNRNGSGGARDNRSGLARELDERMGIG